jgi:integrase
MRGVSEFWSCSVPRKSNVRLTKTVVDRAPLGGCAWDSELPGFGVRVTKAGTKSFILQFRARDGRQGRITLGGFPSLTVDKARDLARAELVLVADGKNPSVERRKVRGAPTVAAMAAYYLDDYGKSASLRPATIQNARHVLVKHALPALGHRKIADISPTDVRRIHGNVRTEVSVYQANRMLAVLSKIFSLAVEQELRPTNPCRGIKKFPEDQRWRNFSDDEVASLLASCDRYHHPNPASAIRLLLFTGARLQETLKAEWSQFDLETGVWEKPSAHTKSKRNDRLQIEGPALDLVRRLRLLDPAGRHLFPGKDAKADPRHPLADLRRPRVDLKRAWEWVRSDAKVEDAHLHDLRRTTASFMLDEEVPLAIIGKALGHTQVSTTARYAQLRQSAQRDGLRKAGQRMMDLPPPKRQGEKAPA